MMYDPARDPLIARFGLRPLPGATRVTDTQIEQARAEERHRRRERSQAVHDAVNAYMRVSGTRDYTAAFNRIMRTRPDLFAGMQDPSGWLATANVNFDPYHDALGRFTTRDAAVDPQGPPHLPAHRPHFPEIDVHGPGRHREHGEPPAQRQEGKETPAPRAIASIRDYARNSRSFATCVVAAVRSMVATMRASTNDPRPEPTDAEVEKQFAAAAGTSIDWDRGLTLDAKGYAAAYARIIRAVLAQNGIPSTAKFNYPSPKALSDDIIVTGVPVIANIITARRGAAIYEHTILIQWDQEQKRFLVNNIDTQGHTTPYTQRQFEGGELRVETKRVGERADAYVNIDFQNAVIFAHKP